ncbi:aminoglycoside phosphotransferase family protein [Microlunatus elymi]|uniref:Aminoglycoside phosphotransferase family protein n=1 Tax=Microlunatus elymi TaxID=2596828 RepID=A0A516Q2Z0_9ACTN|nr:aminoglycoside phosphotransferase family protein [Microlunatus elymi]QDP97793.1 aminoglycoside phosphotransferase family protein [Microlunatus elymi]
MAVTTFLDDLSLDGMLAAIANEPAAGTLDVSAAIRREGWESVVLETPDWIIRFPRHHDTARFETELAVLTHIRGRLPVQTPDVVWTGDHTFCMAYPKITGTDFNPRQWHTATAAERRRLIGSLADLLNTWPDAFTTADILQLGISSIGGTPYKEQLASTLANFPAAIHPSIEKLLTIYSDLYDQELAATGERVLHGDFHLGNMVLDGPCGAVTGLWDFSCVSTGALTWDLHYLAGEVSAPADDPAPPGSGPHLDLLRGVLDRLSNVSTSPETILLLSDLMQCAEWIGDHDPQASLLWQRWLKQLQTR